MDRGNFRSLLSKVGFSSHDKSAHQPLRRTPGALLAGVGRALGIDGNARPTIAVDRLEERVLLEGSFATAIVVNLNPTTGRGTGTGAINPADPATDNDFFSFTAAANDFVSILADTANETPTSNLNTRVTVYGSQSFSDVVASGTTNGTLTTGVARDGWAGFTAQAGRTYYVVVASEGTAAGTYTLRVNAQSTLFDIGDEVPAEAGIGREAGSPIPNLATGLPPITPIMGVLITRQDEIVYKYTAPNRGLYDSLVTVNAQSTQTNLTRRLDTRLDIYNAQGQPIETAKDSDSGRVNDAFTTFRAKPNEVFYIRVRSDEIRNANIDLTRGVFYLVLDAAADPIELNRVTRIASRPGEAFIGFGDPSRTPPAPILATPAPTFQTAVYSFIAMADELAIITAQPTGLAPVNDPALRIFDQDGRLIDSNDDYIGLSAELQVRLIGGNRYFVVVDGFEVGSLVQFSLNIEANHTFDNLEVIDDHLSTPVASQRDLKDATALVFNTPFFLVDANRNPLRDRGQVTIATGSGRIHEAGDNDLFQFTPQVDMLSNYAGNNDDNGLSLFIGGAFDTSDPNSAFPVGNPALGIWDAADYWFTGAQYFDPDFNVTYGFNDNPDTAGTDSPEIYTLFDWNPGGGTGQGNPLNRILVVGGDFDLIVPTPFGPAFFRNLAMWAYDQTAGRWVWADLGQGSANGPIRAITVYDPVQFDPDGAGPLPDIDDPGDEELYVGGDFTNIGGFIDGAGNYLPGVAANHLARLNPDSFAWTQPGAGVNGRVNALIVYDPVDPGAGRPAVPDDPMTPVNEALDAINDAPDLPPSLIIGGLFPNTGEGGLAANNIATWNGVSIGALQGGPLNAVPDPRRPALPGGTNGEVFAFAVYTDTDPDGPNGLREEQEVLVIAGNFSNAGNLTNVGNIVKWGRPNWDLPALNIPNGVPLPQDPTDPTFFAYRPVLRWEVMDEANPNATNGPIFDLQVWDPPDINNNLPVRPPVLVIGGAFTRLGAQAVGNIGEFGPAPFAQGGQPGPGVLSNNYFGLGAVDGAVRALAVLTDDQEPGIATNLRSGVPQEVLYVGGDFSTVRLSPLAAPIAANRVAQFSAFRGAAADFFNWSRMANGVDYTANPPPVQPSTVFALAAFDDGNPAEWDRHDRRQTRVEITVNPASGSFINCFVRLYDSNGAVIYENDTKSPPFPDPAGSIDWSIAPGAFTFEAPGLWGGETYYLEVSSPTGGTGRYTVSVRTDAFPSNGNGPTRNDINSTITEEGQENFLPSSAKIDTNLITGVGTNIVGTENQPLHGNTVRVGRVRPSTGLAVQEAGDIGTISRIDDSDTYYFRAEADGFAEIRIATTLIPDAFAEQLDEFASITKTISSNLDAALRIFDNDFIQLGYFDDNPASGGDFQSDVVGTIGATFSRQDPRAVIPVQAGKVYFIQVESGVRYRNGAPSNPADRELNIWREIDWRRATGAYALIVNDMPRNIRDVENGVEIVDDHTNVTPQFDQNLSTPITIGDNGLGVMLGEINNTPFNPVDVDWSTFFAPASGTVTITLTPITSTLIANLQVGRFNPDTGGLELVITGSGTGRPGDAVTGQFNALGGEQFHVLVSGLSNTEGRYRINITSAPVADDFPTLPKIADAGDIILRDFLGSGNIEGRLESPGDTDVFRFRAESFGTYTVTIDGLEATMRPAVTLYEISEDNAIESGLGFDDPNDPDDPRNNAILLRVGINNNNPAAATQRVQSSLPVTPDRVAGPTPPGTVREYPYYYVVVRGLDPNSDQGNYRVTVTFTPTDDHADGDTNGDGVPDTGEFAFATPIVLDAETGQGIESGIIETNLDSDLFTFTAPTNGDATVLISRPSGSLLRPRVFILDANANIITEAIGDDDLVFYQASASFTAVRGTTYFISVTGFNDPLSPNVNSTDFGRYTVSVNTPPLDDYPNVGEFALSDVQAVIALGSSTGAGQIGGNVVGDGIVNPRIQPSNDTDLFNFTSIRAGSHTISVLPFDTSAGRLAPRVTLMDSSGNVIQTISSTLPLQEREITITNVLAGVKYYVLVQSTPGVLGSTPTGEYRIRVQGPGSGGGGSGDPSDIDFNNPTVLMLSGRTGDTCADDFIEVAGDRDLFTFTTGAAAGRVFVQVLTPLGSLLDASVRILSAPNENPGSTVAFDSSGIPGITATTSFAAQANRQYWVIVDGLGDTVGSYQLCINSRPTNNVLYFPEGYATDTIREFISIVNPNTTAANYSVTLRYETGDLETVITSGIVQPGSRGGTTIIDGTNFQAAGIRKGVPYSVIIESDQPLGATMAHYDFGNAIGDSFTERLSASWNFARVQREPGGVMDFIVFYNPSAFQVDVTLTAYQTGKAPVSSTQTVGALRRGGFSITDMPELPLGVFSVVLTAKATNPSNQPAFEGIVASLSHYSADGSAGFGLLGDPDGGGSSGAITNMFQGQFSRSEAVLFNPGNAAATVTITGSYMRTTLPEFSRTFDIAPGGQVVLTSADFALINDQPVGLRYTSNLPISAMSTVMQNGDSDASTAASVAGTRFLFGDAFMDPTLAGSKFFETLYIYNPSNVNAAITINLKFTDGTSASFVRNVASRRFDEVRLHERPELTSRSGPTWFSMELSTGTIDKGGTPFMVTLTHYDLLLGGGWATTPVPVGFVNSIARIPV